MYEIIRSSKVTIEVNQEFYLLGNLVVSYQNAKHKSPTLIEMRHFFLVQGGPQKTQPMIQKGYYKQRKHNKTLYIL